MEPDGESALCDICQNMPRIFEKRIDDHYASRFLLSLGTLADVRSRTKCPFCNLVVSSVKNALGPSRHTFDADQVAVYWDSEGRCYRLHGAGAPMKTSLSVIELESRPGWTLKPLRHGRNVAGSKIPFQRVEEWIGICVKAIL